MLSAGSSKEAGRVSGGRRTEEKAWRWKTQTTKKGTTKNGITDALAVGCVKHSWCGSAFAERDPDASRSPISRIGNGLIGSENALLASVGLSILALFLSKTPWSMQNQTTAAWSTIMPLRTDLQIMLPRNGPGFYSTHDLIQGHASLEFKKDTAIDEVSVTLEGRANIRVEEYALLANKAGYVSGAHTFLRLSHPIKLTDLPADGVARGQRSYVIPFEFTVPDSLLPYACSHATGDESPVRKAHLLPPPSLGTSEADGVFVNDMGPKTAKVTYAINFQVRKRFRKGGSILLRKTRPVCVVPSRDEAPPIFVEKNDPCYRLSEEKDVYQGPPAIGKAVGHLTAASAEPSAMLLHHPGKDISKGSASTAT